MNSVTVRHKYSRNVDNEVDAVTINIGYRGTKSQWAIIHQFQEYDEGGAVVWSEPSMRLQLPLLSNVWPEDAQKFAEVSRVAAEQLMRLHERTGKVVDQEEFDEED